MAVAQHCAHAQHRDATRARKRFIEPMPPFAEVAARPPNPERNPDHDLHHYIGVAAFVQAEVERGPNVCTLGSQSCQPIPLALTDPLRLRGANKCGIPLQMAHPKRWSVTGLIQALQPEFTDTF